MREADVTTPATDGERRCARCGGRLVSGQLAMALLGTPKFAVRLGALSVEADVAATMCFDCGLVELAVADPERIRKAIRADDLVHRRAGGRGPR